MSKRLDVLLAVRQMLATAVPGALITGLDGDDAAPASIPDGGRIYVGSGDPGEPEFTLSPLTYFYDHSIPVEIAVNRGVADISEAVLDELLSDIGAAVAADRTLGGLVDWLDCAAPETSDLPIFNEAGALVARPPRIATLILVASYSTAGPLA